MAEELIYVTAREYDRLRSGVKEGTPAWGIWLSGFAVGLVVAVLIGWAK